MNDTEILISSARWIFEHFGTGGVLIAYFLWERWNDRKKGMDKSSSETTDLGVLNTTLNSIKSDTSGFGKFSEKLLQIEESQNDLLRESLELSRSNGKALDRIETRATISQ